MPILSEVVRKFESKFSKRSEDECWEWLGYKDRGGRARFQYGRDIYAARVSYRIYKGPIPAGKVVCHTCDNPGCVNPAHLYAGTQKDNVRDMINRGRTNPEKGEDRHCAKLTEVQVRLIQKLYRTRKTGPGEFGVYQSNAGELAKRFGVSRTAIIRAVKKRTWKHIN